MAGKSEKPAGGFKELLIPLVVVTALGGGGGWFLGFSALAPKDGASAEKSAPPHGPENHKDAAKDAHGKDKTEKGATEHKAVTDEKLQVKELPPIVANLGAGKSWIRLLTAIVFDPQELKHPETLIPEIMSDLTAFLNTLDIRDVEGPDGLRRLQEEANERARLRSDGHVRELIVESMVVQ